VLALAQVAANAIYWNVCKQCRWSSTQKQSEKGYIWFSVPVITALISAVPLRKMENLLNQTPIHARKVKQLEHLNAMSLRSKTKHCGLVVQV